MFGLTPLGIVHTAISLVAVAAGFSALLRDRQITFDTPVGKVYALTTVLTCLTGFGIFQHGGFGKPHVLGIVTLVVLGLVVLAAHTTLFGRFSKGVEVVGGSATLLFHMIPAVTETSTRLPPGAPWLASAEAPQLQVATALMGGVFLIGAVLQLRRLRREA